MLSPPPSGTVGATSADEKPVPYAPSVYFSISSYSQLRVFFDSTARARSIYVIGTSDSMKSSVMRGISVGTKSPPSEEIPDAIANDDEALIELFLVDVYCIKAPPVKNHSNFILSKSCENVNT